MRSLDDQDSVRTSGSAATTTTAAAVAYAAGELDRIDNIVCAVGSSTDDGAEQNTVTAGAAVTSSSCDLNSCESSVNSAESVVEIVGNSSSQHQQECAT